MLTNRKLTEELQICNPRRLGVTRRSSSGVGPWLAIDRSFDFDQTGISTPSPPHTPAAPTRHPAWRTCDTSIRPASSHKLPSCTATRSILDTACCTNHSRCRIRRF